MEKSRFKTSRKKNEEQTGTENTSADRRDKKNSHDGSGLKRSLCCNMTSCLSTSDNSTGKSKVRFDDIQEAMHQEDKGQIPAKRKLQRKPKGENVKRKLRRTFTMCCAYDQDLSLDEEDAEELENSEREKRAEDDEANNANTIPDEGRTHHDEQSKKVEVKQLQSFWKMLKPYNMFDEDSNVRFTPSNVLQVYANPNLRQHVNMPVRRDGVQDILPEIFVLDDESSDLTSESYTDSSCDSISNILDIIDADSNGPMCRRAYLTDSNHFGINIDTTARTSSPPPHEIDKKPCNEICLDISNAGENDLQIPENQHQSSGEENSQPNASKVSSTVQGNANQTAAVNDIIVEQHTGNCKINSTVQSNPMQSGSDEKDPGDLYDHYSPSGNINSVQVNSQQTTEELIHADIVKHENSNNGALRHNAETSKTEDDQVKMLHFVHDMLKNDKIKFVPLHDYSSSKDDESKYIDFIYADSGFSHEDAKSLLNEINKLINSKAIEFKFSEDKSSANNLNVSSFNGETLILSQDVVTSASAEENSSDLTGCNLDLNEQNSAPYREKSHKSMVSVVVDDIFEASDNSVTKLTDYITMIRDERFVTVLEDILSYGEGTISSVAHYVDTLRNGQFSLADVDGDRNSKLRNYIGTITEGKFCIALENALTAAAGNRYSLSDYIRVIRDENIYATLGLTLLASELPDEYVQALVKGDIHPEARDLPDTDGDSPSPYSISAEVLRRVSEVRENVTRAIANGCDMYSALSVLDQPNDMNNMSETEFQFSDVNESDIMSACDAISEVLTNATCHKKTHQDNDIAFVDEALFRQENTENGIPPSAGCEAYKASWTVNSPIVRPKTFSQDTSKPSSQCGSTHQAKNRNRSRSRNKQIGHTVAEASFTQKPIGTTDGNSTADTVSGASEVKRSKAEHNMELKESTDSIDVLDTADIQNRIIKTARRRVRNVEKQQSEFTMITLESDTVRSGENELLPLGFIDPDVEVNVPKAAEAQPVYIETEATVDYGRCAVEPGHGERPDKKKLRAEIKEKVKTKGEANKHLRVEKESHATVYEAMMEDYLVDFRDDIEGGDDVENAPEEMEEGACASSPVVLNAADQPQVLDDREFHLVPEEIKRADDPFLEDVEEAYKVSTPHSNKKEKRKQKDDRKKEKRNRKGAQTVLKLS